jgi:hypothetical protein
LWFQAWNDLSSRARHGICLATLAIVALGFMAPELFSSRELVGGDIVQWKAMAQSIFDWEAATGQKPLWATGPFMGMPSVEISYPASVPQIDDIARLLRELFWPTSHLLILFGGTYGLVYSLTRDRWSGVLAAVAFGLTTYLPILLIAGHHSKFVALALAPWLFWAFAYTRKSPGLMSALLFAIATAASLRAGHVQITYYAAFTLGVWWLVDTVRAVQAGNLKSAMQSTAWLVLGGILGVLMVADPYLAKAEYKRFTIRGAAAGGMEGGMGWDYAMGWSQGWAEMLTLVVPNAFGGSGASYWGPKVFTAGPHYIGGAVLLLAAYAVASVRRPAVLGLAIAALLMTAFALGENLEPLNRLMFNYFPLFDAFRVPETWLAMVALVLAILAGFGLREVIRHVPDPADEERLNLGVIRLASIGVGLAAIIMLFGTSALDFERPNELESLARQVAASRPDVSLQDPQTIQLLRQTIERVQDDRKDLFSADARRTFLFVLLAGGLLVAVRKRKLPGFAAQAGLVLLVVLDLGGVGRRYFNSEILVPARQAERVIPEYGFDTFLKERRAEAGGLGHFRVLSLEGDPTVTSRPTFHHESLGGYHGAKLRRYQDFLENILFDRSTGLPSRAGLALSNTHYVVARNALPGMQPVFSDQATGFTVFEVTDPLARGFFVNEVVAEPSPEGQWRRLASPDFNPAQTAVVQEDPGLLAVPDSVHSQVDLVRYTPDEITWRVDTAAPRLFVASEVYYPGGWTATLDGQSVPILAADYLLRGVRVPAGQHELIMTFRPPGRRAGLFVAWGSTAGVYGLLIFLLIVAWRRKRA